MAIIFQYLKYAIDCLMLILYFAVVKVLETFSPSLLKRLEAGREKKFAEATKGITRQLSKEDIKSFRSWPMFKFMLYSLYLVRFKKAWQGGPAHDVPLYPVHKDDEDNPRIDLIEPVTLLSIQRENRPLVVVFGSYSCGIFYLQLHIIKEIARKFKDFMDFAIIYLQEAHPVDAWYMSNNEHRVKSHTNLAERIRNTKYIFEKVQDIPVFVDPMSNDSSSVYAAFPCRIVIVRNGTVIYFEEGYTTSAFKPMLLEEWIEENIIKSYK